jgi:hypothetical protein
MTSDPNDPWSLARFVDAISAYHGSLGVTLINNASPSTVQPPLIFGYLWFATAYTRSVYLPMAPAYERHFDHRHGSAEDSLCG